jgi:glycosyltransferase involved in cell wall biosynthesis
MNTVSVVIPTVGRPELGAAVRSALAQTHPVLEVLVMADTADELNGLPDDPRVEVIRVGPGAGGNKARQTGIEAARGEVVGLLDDDDEWLPTKIEVQLAQVAAARAGDERWLATCRVKVRGHNHGDLVWPDRLIEPSERLVDYLFVKRRVRGGTGFIQASCLLFPRALALETPFDASLRFHQDVSWLVDVAHAHPELRVVQSDIPLSIYLVTPGTGSVSQSIKADASVAWASDRLSADGPRVLGDFILTQSLLLARRATSVSGVLRMLGIGLVRGRPGLPALFYALISLAKVAGARATGRRLLG